MAQEPFERLLARLVPQVRSLLAQRDHLATLADDLAVKLAVAEAKLKAATPPAVATHHFKGYDIPVDLMEMTGGGPSTFDMISEAHINNLRRFISLAPTHTLLEIGCGIGRDAIPLTEILTAGKYVGIDIIKRSIDWCADNISKRHPNFKFYHYDVEDQLHNEAGNTMTSDIYIPLPDRSVDRIILFSVFTHMFQPDIEHYLREFRRVLKPDGLVYATTFIYSDEILEKARATNLTPFDLRFEHQISAHCRINTPSHPLGAVAYTAGAWNEMLAASKMRFAMPMLEGAWSGYYADPKDGQDVAILTPA
jgi:SAM-dependent methyltransferase